jgi:dihydroflavonol-4-reductase
MTTVLIGGGGFLGRGIIDALLARGLPADDLCVVSRKPHASLAARGVAHRAASVLDAAALTEALDGATRVAHLAGRVERSRDHGEALWRLHLEGTRNVMEAVRQRGLGRLVYASTSGVVGCFAEPGRVAGDDDPYCEAMVARWPYYASKIAAERVAFEEGKRHGIDVVALNPSLILGPGDDTGDSVCDVIDFLAGRMPAVGTGTLSFVDVRDAADAFVQAIEGQGVPGKRHLLGAKNLTIRSFFDVMEELSGVRGPRLAPPAWLQTGSIRLLDRGLRKVGSRAPMDPVGVEMGQANWSIDGQRAAEVLGFTPRDWRETLRETITNVRARGLV